MMVPFRTVCPKLPVPHKLRSKAEKPYYNVTERQGDRDPSWSPDSHSPLPNSPVRGFWLLLHLHLHPWLIWKLRQNWRVGGPIGLGPGTQGAPRGELGSMVSRPWSLPWSLIRTDC